MVFEIGCAHRLLGDPAGDQVDHQREQDADQDRGNER
jgi:hypothetical protein